MWAANIGFSFPVNNSKLPHRRPVLSKEMMLKCAEESGVRPNSPNAALKRPVSNPAANYQVRNPAQIPKMNTPPLTTPSQSNSVYGGHQGASSSNKNISPHHHQNQVSPNMGAKKPAGFVPNSSSGQHQHQQHYNSNSNNSAHGHGLQKSPGSGHLDYQQQQQHKQLTKTNSHPTDHKQATPQRSLHSQSGPASISTGSVGSQQPFFINNKPTHGNSGGGGGGASTSSSSNYSPNNTNSMQRSTGSGNSSNSNISPGSMQHGQHHSHNHHGNHHHHHQQQHHAHHHSQSARSSSLGNMAATPGKSTYSNQPNQPQYKTHAVKSTAPGLANSQQAQQASSSHHHHHQVSRPVPYPTAGPLPHRVHPNLNPYSQKF